MKSISAIHLAITENAENMLVKCTPRMNYWNSHKQPVRFVLSYVLSVMQQYKQRTAWKVSLQSVLSFRKICSWNACPTPRYVKALKPLRVYRTSCDCEERMGDQSLGTQVAPWCKHRSSCGWWKGTSQDEATLISEEIKSLALAILELCLSEGISKYVSKQASQSVSRKIC